MKALEFITYGWYDWRDLKSRAITMTPKDPNSSEKKNGKTRGAKKRSRTTSTVDNRPQISRPMFTRSSYVSFSTAASSTLHS